MPKPRRIGRPPNQRTNHTKYGRWEGAQGVVRPSRRVVCGKSKLEPSPHFETGTFLVDLDVTPFAEAELRHRVPKIY